MNLTVPALDHRFPGDEGFSLRTPEFKISNSGYTCVIGKNGSGKSTFARTLSQNKATYNWFYVPQYLERFLYAVNLEEQLKALFSQDIDRAAIGGLLQELGFSDIPTILNFPFILMSGGERRRIALACALYTQPEYLILDEPDIGIAEKESIVILSKLNNLRAINTSLMLITHNARYVHGSSDLICLENGRIGHCGSTKVLMSDSEFDLKQYGVREN